jgi:CDP-paratose 2-epimerase
MSASRSVLVTGGAGFVGSNLSLHLKRVHPEWRVLALDNLRRRGSELNLSRLRSGGVEFLHGDIRSPEDLPAGDLDAIVECAAEPSVQAGYGGDSPRYVIDANLTGLINCLDLARQRRADLIFLSTSRVYPVQTLNELNVREEETRFTLERDQVVPGASEHGIAEAFPLEGERSIYGATKLCGELLTREFAAAYGLRTVITRCGVITGPWQMGKVDQGVFSLWMAAHLFDRPLAYIGWGGTGKQVRDLLHVDDLCELVDLQLTQTERFQGGVFNAGGGVERSLSLLETTRLCAEITGMQVPIRSEPANRPADLRIFVTDARRIAEQTGWTPRRSAEETLSDIYRWMRDHRETLGQVFAA